MRTVTSELIKQIMHNCGFTDVTEYYDSAQLVFARRHEHNPDKYVIVWSSINTYNGTLTKYSIKVCATQGIGPNAKGIAKTNRVKRCNVNSFSDRLVNRMREIYRKVAKQEKER